MREPKTFTEEVMRQVRWLDRQGRWAKVCATDGHNWAAPDDFTDQDQRVYWVRRCIRCGYGECVRADYPTGGQAA